MLKSVSFGNNIGQNWKQVNINKHLSPEMLEMPDIRSSAGAYKNNKNVAASSMSMQEALYGRPRRENHLFRNHLLGAATVLGGLYALAKHKKDSLNEGDLKTVAEIYERSVNKLGTLIKDGWNKLFKKETTK